MKFDHNSFKKRGNVFGLSLTEVMIAVFLLAIAFGSIAVVFRGAGLESTFTSEHYTAMFLAQKVLEDINAMVRDNPYSFNDLIEKAAGEEESVVNGHSEYFRLLENTQNFGFLHESDDDPIRDGPLFKQLQPFTVQVSCNPQPDPATGQLRKNLIEVVVTVRWKNREGRSREYVSTQLLQGINDEVYLELPNQTLTPGQILLMDRGAIAYLAGILGLATSSATLSDVLAANPGATPDVMLNLGRTAWLSEMAYKVETEAKEAIRLLEEQRDALKDLNTLETQVRFTDLQRSIASRYEHKAVQQIGFLLLARQPIDDFLGAIRASPLSASGTTFIIGQTLYLQYNKKVQETMNQVFMTIRMIPMGLSTAEDIYLKLLNPPYLDLIPRGQEPAFFRKVLDVQKLGILRHKSDADAKKLLPSLNKNLDQLLTRYEGRFPHFLTYLRREKEFASSLDQQFSARLEYRPNPYGMPMWGRSSCRRRPNRSENPTAQGESANRMLADPAAPSGDGSVGFLPGARRGRGKRFESPEVERRPTRHPASRQGLASSPRYRELLPTVIVVWIGKGSAGVKVSSEPDWFQETAPVSGATPTETTRAASVVARFMASVKLMMIGELVATPTMPVVGVMNVTPGRLVSRDRKNEENGWARAVPTCDLAPVLTWTV
jgi:hypothetical protein